MRRFESPVHALRALAQAIGLDIEKTPVKSIDLHADCKNVPTVAVTMLIDIDQRGQMCEVIRRYRLEEINPDLEAAGTTAVSEMNGAVAE